MKNPFVKTLLLSVSAGMRCMAPLSLISTQFHQNKQEGLKRSKLNFIQTGLTSTILNIAALGELAGDKNPAAPNRTQALGVLGRGASGALVGTSIAYIKRLSRIP